MRGRAHSAAAPVEQSRYGQVGLIAEVQRELRHTGNAQPHLIPVDGQLPGRRGTTLTVVGLWGIAFGNGGMAGPKDTLFFAAGPHRWLGASELSVHGLFGSISLAAR